MSDSEDSEEYQSAQSDLSDLSSDEESLHEALPSLGHPDPADEVDIEQPNLQDDSTLSIDAVQDAFVDAESAIDTVSMPRTQSLSPRTSPKMGRRHSETSVASEMADDEGDNAPVAPPRRRKKRHQHDNSEASQTNGGPISDTHHKASSNDTTSSAAPSQHVPLIQTSAAPSGESQPNTIEFKVPPPRPPPPSIGQRTPSSLAANTVLQIEPGRELTDEEILASVTIKCLDTGEVFPLSEADKIALRAVGPLALQMKRRTSDLEIHRKTASAKSSSDRKKRIKKFLNKAKDKARDAAERARDRLKGASSDGESRPASWADLEAEGIMKVTCHRDRSAVFPLLRTHQVLKEAHKGAIWSVKMSCCGRLMATAGQDHVVRVWALRQHRRKLAEQLNLPVETDVSTTEDDVFHPVPLCELRGHSSDVLDLAWSPSQSFFLLSSSMDKTVRLWHLSKTQPLSNFVHKDFVTAIAFHPRNDRYFLSGSMDGRLRLWSIPERRVVLWNKVGAGSSNLITAANFCRGGQLAVVGTYDGRIIFFNAADRLKYHTQMVLQSKRGRRKGRKVTGIEPMVGQDKILVTSNDSRLRIINLSDLSLTCKYRGCSIPNSQLRASFSHDARYILCGSEDRNLFLWETDREEPQSNKRNWRRDRNEDAHKFTAHEQIVTAATFAPREAAEEFPMSDVIISCDVQGTVKVFMNHRP